MMCCKPIWKTDLIRSNRPWVKTAHSLLSQAFLKWNSTFKSGESALYQDIDSEPYFLC